MPCPRRASSAPVKGQPPAPVAASRSVIKRPSCGQLHGIAADGRLFRGDRGGDLSESLYGRVWQGARRLGFIPAVAASPLAGRAYDLRHACLSTWLNAGVDSTRVAEWAGNGVDVLLHVYAKCIHGRDQLNRQRMEDALRNHEDGE
jgi:integrase